MIKVVAAIVLTALMLVALSRVPNDDFGQWSRHGVYHEQVIGIQR